MPIFPDPLRWYIHSDPSAFFAPITKGKTSKDSLQDDLDEGGEQEFFVDEYCGQPSLFCRGVNTEDISDWPKEAELKRGRIS